MTENQDGQTVLGLMRASKEIDKIAPALCKFQGMISNAKAGTENEYYSSNYATLGDIWNEIRKPLADCELCVLQTPKFQLNDNSEQTGTYFVRVQTMLLHSSGQYMLYDFDMPFTLGMTQKGKEVLSPQKVGSAATYGRRYGLAPFVGIAQEDDDGNSASGKNKGNNDNREIPITADNIIADLEIMKNDAKTTKKEVSSFLFARDVFIKKLSKEDMEKVKVATSQVMEKFKEKTPDNSSSKKEDPKPEVNPPVSTSNAEADSETNTDTAGEPFDFKTSLDKTNEIVVMLGKANTVEEVNKIMNESYMPNETKFNPTHKKILLKTHEGMIAKVGK